MRENFNYLIYPRFCVYFFIGVTPRKGQSKKKAVDGN